MANAIHALASHRSREILFECRVGNYLKGIDRARRSFRITVSRHGSKRIRLGAVVVVEAGSTLKSSRQRRRDRFDLFRIEEISIQQISLQLLHFHRRVHGEKKKKEIRRCDVTARHDNRYERKPPASTIR